MASVEAEAKQHQPRGLAIGQGSMYPSPKNRDNPNLPNLKENAQCHKHISMAFLRARKALLPRHHVCHVGKS
eukprot:1817422-Amphidinium_carterae.1